MRVTHEEKVSVDSLNPLKLHYPWECHSPAGAVGNRAQYLVLELPGFACDGNRAYGPQYIMVSLFPRSDRSRGDRLRRRNGRFQER